jgi:hypothetical protein
MLRHHRVAYSVLTGLLLVVSPVSYPQSNGKTKVSSQADLPRFTYPIKGSASDLVQPMKPPLTRSPEKSKHTSMPSFVITRWQTNQPSERCLAPSSPSRNLAANTRER